MNNKLVMDIYKKLKEFSKNDEQFIAFPSTLNGEERKNIHMMCAELGLNSESRGDKPNRFLIVTKNDDDKNKLNSNSNISNNNYLIDVDRKYFIKDFSLPIPVWKEPYFSYFTELYENDYNIKDKLNLLKEAKEEAKKHNMSLTAFIVHIKDSIVKTIKSTKAYSEYVQQKMQPNKTVIKQTTIYKFTDDAYPKFYISIDMIKANYNSMKYTNPELVLHSNSWEELIDKFTKCKYFKESKYLRQMIFGHLKGKKSGNIQLNMLTQLWETIINYNSLNPQNKINIIGRTGNEEIMIKTMEEKIVDDTKLVQKLLLTLPKKFASVWKVEPFKIEPILPTTGFIKHVILDINKSIDDENNIDKQIKCVNKDLFAQVYKMHNKLKINDNDLCIMKDDNIVKYIKPVF